MHKIDALSTTAFCVLSLRRQTADPTLNEIMLAVVQSASLLGIDLDCDAPKVEVAAAADLMAKHGWRPTASVHLLNRGVNGFQHKPKPTGKPPAGQGSVKPQPQLRVR